MVKEDYGPSNNKHQDNSPSYGEGDSPIKPRRKTK